MHFPNRLETLIAADGLNRGIERSAGDARKPSRVRGIFRFRLPASGFGRECSPQRRGPERIIRRGGL